ncbi:MAG: CBS domain-containing protein [Gammaproteobacteria bacterium]|nr:CBS domain-containing protein [Gammaproteobacteria bacterium]
MTQSIVHTLAKDCMTTTVITVSPYDTLARAYELMMANRIRRLPVLEGARLVGIITLSDLLEVKQSDPTHRHSLSDVAQELGHLVVSTIMRPKPICIYDVDTLGHAAELMLENKIGGLPVIDASEHVVGVLTESNIFQLLAQRWRDDNLIFSGVASRE